MAHSTSAGVALLLAILMFATMQKFRSCLVESQPGTILGGFAGSNIFLLLLTAVSNAEMEVFGSGFQSKLFPEAIICLFMAAFASALVHRVCVTTCVIFSLVLLYCMDKISASHYSHTHPVAVGPVSEKKKRK